MENFHARVDVNSRAIYDHFLRSIHGISISEEKRFETLNTLEDIDKDLHEYDTYINRLENKLALVKSQRKRLLKHKAALESLLSPIHRLPNEILARLFGHALAGEPSTYHDDELFMRTGCMLRIAAVCHRWRSLALSCPELWTNFGVFLSFCGDERDLRLERLIDLHLERSKQRPLAITICSKDIGPAHPLLQKLARSSSRWQNLSLLFKETTCHSLYALDLPILETFEQSVGARKPVSIASPMLRTIRGQPTCLTNASLWAQITHLESQTPESGIQKFFEVLQRCTNLQHLEVLSYVHGYGDILAPRTTPLKIPITSLSLSFSEWDLDSVNDLIRFGMTSFTAPALSTLKLMASTYRDSPSSPIGSAFPVIQEFLVRSRCALTVLVMDRVPITDQELVDVLKRHPSLVDLTIKESAAKPEFCHRPVTKAFIESLQTNRPRPLQQFDLPIPLVPKLHSLYLSLESTPFHYDSLINTILSRWIPDQSHATATDVACLRSVVVHLAESVKEDQCSPLVQLERSGMRIVIEGNDGDIVP